jgi:cbb3-type cytochrome oxidase subunit 1
MEIYAKRFTKMALIYLVLGVVMGVVIGTQPEWSQRLRFVHIHLNLLGFMTMFISGVAYHVLPRFNAPLQRLSRPLAGWR